MAQPITVEPVTQGRVTIKTTAGDVVIELWPREAKQAVRNFVQLALEGYYDGCQFHRVVPGFCVQTGDASNSGEGGDSIYDGDHFPDEISQRLRFNRRGIVACANAGKRNTNLSQFFITLDKAEALNGKHTIFGTVKGDTYFNVVKISESELQPDSERPVYPPSIKTIEVDDNPFPDIVPRITAAEKREQVKARKEARKAAASRGKKKEGVKNKSLVSFGDDEEAAAPPTAGTSKLTSAHDALADDPTLRAESKDHGGLPLRMPEGFGENLQRAKSVPKRKAEEMQEQRPSRVKASDLFGAEAYSTRVEEVAANDAEYSEKHGKGKKSTKADNGTLSEADRVKAEIAKVQADLKSLTRRGSANQSEGSSTNGNGKKQSKHDGAALLAAERAKYATGGRSVGKGSAGSSKGKKRKVEDDDLLDALNGFRSKLRTAAASAQPEVDETEAQSEEPIDGYAGEILEGDDDDDTGWMGHTLKFRKDATLDQHKIDEYEVIDPRSQNMTLEEAKRQEARLKRQSGPLGNAMAKAERDVGRGERDGNRNRANDSHRDRGRR